eukprot:TRINITY_DN25944_c0_g1_i1.p1 TRINITY_DN25944_c0_g1~~TRINITY_DN25944_c0_g1_i1.p1  ORF type:complete len:513 (+),score=103.32 TRINITY_DN25944_c0_g1_i1:32-1570(+)
MTPVSVLMDDDITDMASLGRGLQTVKGWLMPLSAISLCIFPLALFAFIVFTGLRARPGRASVQYTEPRSAKVLQDSLSWPWSWLFMVTAAAAAVMPLLLIFPGSLLGFVHIGAFPGAFPGAASLKERSDAQAMSFAEVVPASSFVAGMGGPCLLAVVLGAAAMRILSRRNSFPQGRAFKKSQPRETLHCRASNAEAQPFESETHVGASILRYATPADPDASLWHHVDLKVRDWLDHDTGELRYISEMPKGCLQKFELQTQLEKNAIREDAKGSKKLQEFGRATPFNYGCFPQTYRDPQERDEVYDAPGDDDPLDVIDLGAEVSIVGQVVRCRPLGAVCLIDEGRADWKVMVVNTELRGPLAAARSIEDVERLSPGRVAQVLQWVDDFKRYSSRGEARLHFEIHGSAKARALIEKDHLAWKRLLTEAQAGGRGRARGHWISQVWTAGGNPATVLDLGTAAALPPVLCGRRSSSANSHSLARMRCISRSTSSDDASSATHSEHSPVSSETEPGF